MHMIPDHSSKNVSLQRWILVLAIVLFVVKMTAYYLTHSVAILSDALETTVNVFSGFFGLFSLYLAAKPSDVDHPNGHGKIEFISAGIEGTLIIISALVIIYQSIIAFETHNITHQLNEGIILISLAGVLNLIFGVLAVKQGKKNHSIALEASGKHLLSDVYTTLGVVGSLGLLILTNWWWIDSLIALIFALIILISGIKILRSSVAGIMDEADKKLLAEMVVLLQKERIPKWIDIHNMRIIKYGHLLHIDCHLTLPWYFTVKQGHTEMVRLENLIASSFQRRIELFVHIDYCEPKCCSICSISDCDVRQKPHEKSLPWTIENITINAKHGVSD